MARELKEMPDYTTLSGAEFQREVGVDPRKWAEAFVAICQVQHPPFKDNEELIALLADWFSDAMNAARKDWRKTVMGLEGE